MRKTFFFLSFIIGLLSLVGCSKDDSTLDSGNNMRSNKVRWYGVKNSELPTTRGVADEVKLWNQRVGIPIKFINSPTDPGMIDKIKSIAKEWENYAGIKFNFIDDDQNAAVRIAFDWQGNDYLTWSYTGTDARSIKDQSQPTAVFGGLEYADAEQFKGDVLRVFGQILGLEYEQRHQDWTFWKSEAKLQTYWEDMFDGMNMDWDEIRDYVFTPLTGDNAIYPIETPEVDELSVMAWPYYTRAQATKLIANFALSEGDKAFIAKLYPKDNQSLPTIQEAWVDAGYFEWATKENWDIGLPTDDRKWVDGTVALRMTRLGASQEYLPDVSDGEQLNSASGMFTYTSWGGYFGSALKKMPKFNTSNITDFKFMFYSATSLTEVDLFDTAKGTNFYNMFSQCLSLENVPNFNTSNGTNFAGMFDRTKIKEMPLLDTSKGTSFAYMFSDTKISKISFIDTSKGTDFSAMFSNTKLKDTPQIPINVSKGTSFAYMFSGTDISSIPFIDTSNGTNFSSMFSNCSLLTSIPLLDTSNGTDFSFMFVNCKSLTSIPKLNTSKGTNFAYMLQCTSIANLPLLDTSNGVYFQWMLAATPLTTIPPLNTSKGIIFQGMLGSTALTTIPLLDTSNGTNFEGLFSNCKSLTNIPLLDTSKGLNFRTMFSGCTSLTSIPPLNTSKGTEFVLMFNNCSSLQEKPILDLSKAIDTRDMYAGTPFAN